MVPVEPIVPQGSKLVIYAKDQPQYHPLAAAVSSEGVVRTEWEPTSEELELLLQGGRVCLSVHTFGNALQPVRLEVLEPACGTRGR